MYWKMSIDLTRPLVPSAGQHDPLDGFITYNQLQVSAPKDPRWPNLMKEIGEIGGILEGRELTTDDPLGVGSLLCDAYKVAELILKGYWNRTDLLNTLLESSHSGLEIYLSENPLEFPAELRLAFRELGLSLGLRAVEKLQKIVSENPHFFGSVRALRTRIQRLVQRAPLIQEIEGFWLRPESRETSGWKEHRDINMVMLATSLCPDGYLGL
jgi:hypothetical protein